MKANKEMEIVYEYGPSGKCPVQAEGRINGRRFYFRSRGGHWTLYVAGESDDVFSDDAWIHRERYCGIHAFRDAEINDGKTYAAGWADEDECMEFIQKAAQIWFNHTPTP